MTEIHGAFMLHKWGVYAPLYLEFHMEILACIRAFLTYLQMLIVFLWHIGTILALMQLS
jgi:hypothetical protein